MKATSSSTHSPDRERRVELRKTTSDDSSESRKIPSSSRSLVGDWRNRSSRSSAASRSFRDDTTPGREISSPGVFLC